MIDTILITVTTTLVMGISILLMWKTFLAINGEHYEGVGLDAVDNFINWFKINKMKKITWRQLFRKLIPKWPPNIFGKQKLLMAFEFGMNISQVAKEMKVEVTPEMIYRAENILLEECRNNTAVHFACNMVSYTLAVFEPKEHN